MPILLYGFEVLNLNKSQLNSSSSSSNKVPTRRSSNIAPRYYSRYTPSTLWQTDSS